MSNYADTLKKLFQRNKNVWRTDMIIIGVFLVIVVFFVIWNPELPTRSEVDSWTEQFGGGGPLTIIGIIILETVIAPIPGTIIPIVIGALYGVWPGVLYAWIGNVIGSTIAFYISRKLGRPIALKIVKEKTLQKYDQFLHRNGLLIWLVYAIPIFPIDIISFVVGLSKITYRKFFVIMSVGFTINLLMLTFFGDRLLESSGSARMWYIGAAAIIVVLAVTVEKLVAQKK